MSRIFGTLERFHEDFIDGLGRSNIGYLSRLQGIMDAGHGNFGAEESDDS